MSHIRRPKLSPAHPPAGTLIDGGTLQLVEVLDVGSYGVVYRAIETRPSTTMSKSYSVKCLVTPPGQNGRERQRTVREIALHQLASRHPGVITLHRVVETLNLTYIVMDHAPDHNLSMQISQSCRYLGDDTLIKHVFLQLLEAVEYCHSLGIYHRDLKPESILCYDDGLRITITDFGLASTEKVSDEFHIGTVSHMGPECQGGAFAPQGNYSPMHNDIWSLGIILLNLATGRSPWKSATVDDGGFQAYLRSPNTFLSSVLPISSEVNKILIGMLAVDYRRRTSLREVRRSIQHVGSFYSDGVVFEGSIARCPWEMDMDVDTDSSEDGDASLHGNPSSLPGEAASDWSNDSTSDTVFARQGRYDASRMPPERSTQSPISSPPTTPNRKPLTINTNIPQPRFYHDNADIDAFSEDSAIMQTAIEYDPYSSMFYLTSAISEDKVIALPATCVAETEVKRKSKKKPEKKTPKAPAATARGIEHKDLRQAFHAHSTLENEVTTRLTQMLASVLQNSVSRKALYALQGSQAQLMVEYLHELLQQPSSSNNSVPWLHKHSLIALYRLSKSSLLYPHCYALKGIEIGSHECGGGFSDIFKGHHGDQHVCLKVVRLHQKAETDTLLKVYAKEAILWGQLHHRNIVPFYGIYYFNEERRQICLVSPWMKNGNLIQYLKNNSSISRTPFVHDITAGLEYLHDQSLIHSDLKGVNVLVNDSGIACITDFGLSSIRTDQTLAYTSIATAAHGVSHNWAAPELLDDDQFPTSASDVWALGCVFYEILTGKPPFHGLSEAQVIRKLIAGATPQRPDPSDMKFVHGAITIWTLIQKCWTVKAEGRPSCGQILEVLISEKLTRSEGSYLLENDMQAGRLRFEKAMRMSQEISIDYVAVEGILGTVSAGENRNAATDDPKEDGSGAGTGVRRGKIHNDGKKSEEVPSRAPVGRAGRVVTVDQEAPSRQQENSSTSSRQSRFSVGRRTRRAESKDAIDPRHWFVPGRFFASAGGATS